MQNPSTDPKQQPRQEPRKSDSSSFDPSREAKEQTERSKTQQPERTADQDPQRIEIPGRHGIENEPDKEKAYGPGGGRVVDADKARRDAGGVEKTGGTENPDRARPEPIDGSAPVQQSGQGADTAPM